MKACAFCKEQIQDEAIKCRYCGSSLLPLQPAPENAAKNSDTDDRRVTYVVDSDLIRFGKFAAAVLAVFVAVGLFLYGLDIKNSLKEVSDSLKEAADSTDKAKQSSENASNAQAEATKAAESAKQEAAQELATAQKTLKDIQASSDSLLADETRKENEIKQKVTEVASIEKNVSSARDDVNKERMAIDSSLSLAQQGASAIGQICQKAALQSGQSPTACNAETANHAAEASAAAPEPPPVSEPASRSFSAPELARLYNFPANLEGKGQTIGIVELGGGFSAAGFKQYFARLNLPAPKIESVSVDGATNSPTNSNSADGQVQSDIEIVGSLVPQSILVVYFAPNTDKGFADAIGLASLDKRVSILAISWGGPESTWSHAGVGAMNDKLEEAASKGITVIVASGDNGVTDGVADGKPHVDFPASSPWVLACGGTAITVADDKITSEVAWNDLSESGGATGGGVSALFSVPAWQSNLSLPAGKLTGRAIPDVAINVRPAAGYRVIIDGQPVVLGGTTTCVPMWAALIAKINEALGTRVGFINEKLYQAIGPSGAFRKIDGGNNGSEKLPGYSATPGWNAAVGWGSPDGEKLLNAFRASYAQSSP